VSSAIAATTTIDAYAANETSCAARLVVIHLATAGIVP
jgi:hypothetical protein